MLKFKMHVLFSSFVPYLLSGRAVTYIRVTGNQTGCCTIHRIHKMATQPRLVPLVDKGPLPFSRNLTIPHLDLSHFALCIMGN